MLNASSPPFVSFNILVFFASFFLMLSRNDVKMMKKTILTSKSCLKYPFVGQNAQQIKQTYSIKKLGKKKAEHAGP